MREWLRVMYRLRGEIAFGAYHLPEVFLRVARQETGAFSAFLKDCSEDLMAYRGKMVAEVWSERVLLDLKDVGLKKEDLERLDLLGGQLGSLDQKTQLEFLQLGVREWEEALAKEEAEVSERVKLRRTLGILFGIFVTILFL